MQLRLYLFAFCLFLTVSVFSQELDKIHLYNKDVIIGKILKVDDTNIEIDPEGGKPFLIIKRKDVKVLIYSDNTVVYFKKENIEKVVPNNMIDDRDGKSYKIGLIGSQVWMLENLNYSIEGSKCYKNDYKYCEQKGRLYSYSQACKSCPEGWRIPTYDDWKQLERFIAKEYEKTIPYSDGSWARTVGKALKSKKDWNRSERGGYNAYDFNAVPSGMYGYNSENKRTGFFSLGNNACWFGYNKGSNNYTISSISEGRFSIWNYNSKGDEYMSLRCIKKNENN